MASRLKMFALLLYKNLIVRKRHWRTIIFLQTLVPILLFSLLQAVRDYSVKSPVNITKNIHYPIQTKADLTNIDHDLTRLYYLPKNNYTIRIMESTRYCLGLISENVKGFSNETEMVDTYTLVQAENPLMTVMAVVFEQYEGRNMKYKIRHSWKVPYNLFQTFEGEHLGATPTAYFDLIPFAQIQMCVDEALINQKIPDYMSNIKMSIQRMPYPPHVKIDDSDTILRAMIATFAVIIFIIPLCVEASYAAQEKFIGVNVLMAMNGVKQFYNLLSWLFIGILFSNLYIIPIIALFKTTFNKGVVVAYMHYGNGFIFWLLFTANIAHLISFGMHIAAYFSRPRFVTIVLSITYIAAFALHENLWNSGAFRVIPYFGIIFPNILFYRLFEESNTYESKLIGVQWDSFFVTGNIEYGMVGSTGFIFLFSILGAVIHFTLAVYINAVFPGKYGVQKDPFYFLKCMKKNKISLDDEAGELDYDKIGKENFEPVLGNALIPGIQIRDLKKSYTTNWLRKPQVHALRGISVDFYKGEITALLGHNGAGKTTLMSILTGVTDQTQGKVFINGKNIVEHLENIRNDLGLCPQENMVFPDLNVFEQIEFIGLLKAERKSRYQIRQDVDLLLSKLKLSEKRDFLPSKLSGGQQRRLCLGMALIGDASIIILDEPTSGMDPETRRDTWDMILKLRGEKTILISTHNMEEADILGDRIAIIHIGRLKSFGTAMFLKKQHGHGHVEVTLSIKSWCEPAKIINKFDPRTQQLSVDSEKMLLSVPYTASLPRSLDSVESEKKKLGVTGISVSLITLEQVFLKIAKNEDNGKHLNELFTAPVDKIRGNELYLQSLLALLSKKFTYTRKNLANLLAMLMFPLLSILLISLSYNLPSDPTNIVPLRLDMYRYPKALYSSDNETIGRIYEDTVSDFGGSADAVFDTSVTNALLNISLINIAEYRNNYIVSAEFNSTMNETLVNGFYSGIALHGVPLTVNLLSNTLIKTFADNKHSIDVSRQQLPNTLASTRIQMPEAESLSRTLLFCAFFFPTVAIYVVHPLQEKATNVKQLQRMTGVSTVSYWGTMFTVDFLIYTMSVLIIALAYYIMDVILDIRLYYRIEIISTILLLELFGINVLFIVYMFSFLSKSRSTVITILSLAPLGLVIIQYVLHELIHTFDNLKLLHIIQKRMFRLIPYVSLYHGHLAFYNIAMQNARCRRLPNKLHEITCFVRDPCCGLDCSDGECRNQTPYFQNFKDDINFEECILYLGLTPILYFTILLCLEEKLFPLIFRKAVKPQLRDACDKMDDQVKKEKHVVALEINKIANKSITTNIEVQNLKEEFAANRNSEILQSPISEGDSLFLVYELSKYYGKLMAVREISFRVKARECFGLLGVNGAGKSTTFRMLTGEETPNSGIMYLGRANIHSNRKEYLSEMGYCPQTDALIPSLNTFDHLRLFARLRGIPKSNVELEVNKWINRLNLTAYMWQPSGTYSGGNKRRLNIAMALIGNPTLVLLDEPTTGVDPAARRSLWNTLQSCQAAGQAIILTSHSMEECEALCNRLVIMVKGQLVCIGASQELKQRFGAGYDIHVKLNPDRTDEEAESIKNIIESSLTCDIRDENLGLLAYHVTDCDTTWEKMYNTMDDVKRRYNCIEDYAVLSATLEQLFIQFARGAEAPPPPPQEEPSDHASHEETV
ncbi:PREDICTED: ATP-binding cassette sub-family A member 1-like [Dinoponera quadriceps]|uniref:ATP-binding cassette sub-family A member 1-like n=1 Tax=Dinoponera quadriceps TaxID=609295 RepID=A0A6P3Y630_DINQU|nr:PREDICTED: ATP-binding cassette sub-family A member 1-like [Dinoponera quadriceps]XP_014485768.1 PREDICTED: ATP-binding cassette sub-family A member 1-like [Dinoponera quadriceps]